jgi:hypothetical protein
MEKGLFSLGVNARICVGKNINYLEMDKLVPVVLRVFEVILQSSCRMKLLAGTLRFNWHILTRNGNCTTLGS